MSTILALTPRKHNNQKTDRISRFLLIGCAGASLALVALMRHPLFDLLAIVANRDAVASYFAGFGVLAPLLLAIMLVLQVIVATIPGHALIVGAGYVFGFAPAFFISWAATVLGSQLGFLLARWAGRPLVAKLAPAESLDRWHAFSAEKGLLFFTFSFMLPIFPADVMNYVAGLSALPTRRFFIANLFGRLPGVVLMTAVGAYGLRLSFNYWLVIAGAGAALYLAWRRYYATHD